MAEFNDAVYIITLPGDLPKRFNLPYYRGDSDSFVFVCREPDAETPFNIRVADSYHSQIRDVDGNLIAELDAADFITGQSEECIAYLSDNSLPADDIHDELHCLIKPALLEDVETTELYIDVEIRVANDVYTVGSGKIKMTKDITT